jgi:hypothetical protein
LIFNCGSIVGTFESEMKYVLLSILLILASCDKDDPGPQLGCSTGVRKSSGQRELIRCCTKEQHLSGDNVNEGGVSSFSFFTNHEWTAVSDCSECQ